MRSKSQELAAFDQEWQRQIQGGSLAGVDEAGRGPLAGPVVAVACRAPDGFFCEGVQDSKKISPKKREELFEFFCSCTELDFGISVVTHQRIDEINILQATLEGMREALAALTVQPALVLVDGNLCPKSGYPERAIPKGDDQSLSIALASIVAKVTRDRMMLEYDAQWPEYGFAKHKGYGTKAHREAIQKYGPCPIHRMSFAPLNCLAPCQ